MPASQPLVLLVEDEAIIRMVACDYLQDAGLRVIEAANSNQAMDAVQENPDIDLLFTDINMPGGVDGLELARQVHRARPNVEIILTSGREWLRQCDIPDDGDFVQKPYSLASVVRLVKEKLSKR